MLIRVNYICMEKHKSIIFFFFITTAYYLYFFETFTKILYYIMIKESSPKIGSTKNFLKVAQDLKNFFKSSKIEFSSIFNISCIY